jgi:hypothetical protein
MAPPTIHEIDPDYDTVIVLTDPCKHFAPWILGAENSKDGSQDGSCGLPGNVSEQEISAESSRDQSAPTSDTTGAADDHDVSPTEHHLSAIIDINVADISVQSTKQETEVIHYRVSSRHLTLASLWFKRTLTSSGSREALPDPSDGRYYVNASEWDEEAFLILLNALHVRRRQVPKTVTLEMLAKLAVLIDYYELQDAEAIEDWVDGWKKGVKENHTVPPKYSRDLMLWLCISAVFGMSRQLEMATEWAIRESWGPLETLGLPIPQIHICKFHYSTSSLWPFERSSNVLQRISNIYGSTH